MSVFWQNNFRTSKKNWFLNSPPNGAVMLMVSVLISPINSTFFFPWSHLEIQVSFFKFSFLDITLPALESIWIYCSSLINLIVPSAFLLFCTRPYNTLSSPANMNVLNCMFSLFTQRNLCLRHTVRLVEDFFSLWALSLPVYPLWSCCHFLLPKSWGIRS